MDNITKDYKKVDRSELDDLNVEAAKICRELGIEDRVMKFCESEAFITYKDHKEDFNLRQKQTKESSANLRKQSQKTGMIIR